METSHNTQLCLTVGETNGSRTSSLGWILGRLPQGKSGMLDPISDTYANVLLKSHISEDGAKQDIGARI